MNNCIVLYDDWQFECCGEDFEVGSNIKWLVLNAESIDLPIKTDKIDYFYEAHSSDYEKLFVLEGKIKQIKALYEKYRTADDNPRLLVPVDGVLDNIHSSKEKAMQKDDMVFSYYLVYIEIYSIRSALKSEV